MTSIPTEHVEDALKLTADGIVELFELSPSVGGTIYFKPDNTATWQGNEYVGVPLQLSDLRKSSEQASSQPRLIIGQENIDLSIFKPLLFDGSVDGGVLLYRRVLLDHLTNDINISEDIWFRVKRPESYSRTRISLALSTSSDSVNFTLPNKQFYPPAFPAVTL